MNKKTTTIVSIVLLLIILGAIGGGLFYLFYEDSVELRCFDKNGVPIDSVNGEVHINVGEKFWAEGVLPDNKIYLMQKFTYSSSNDSIASVDDNGKVTGKKVGSANITVTSKFFKRTDSVKVVIGYGVPNKVEVDVVSGGKQYVGDTLQKVVFKATTKNGDYETQDPVTISFKWKIYDIANNLIEEKTTKQNTYEYEYSTNEYQKVHAECQVLYNGSDLIGVKKRSLEATLFERIKQEDIGINVYRLVNGKEQLITDLTKVEMGSELVFKYTIANKKADRFAEHTHALEFDKQIVKKQGNAYLLDKKGDYTLTLTFIENGQSVSKTITITTQYKVLKAEDIILDRTRITQSPDNLRAFNVVVSWSRFADKMQPVAIEISGSDNFGGSKTLVTMPITRESGFMFSVSPVKDIDGIQLYVDGDPTGVYVSLSNPEATISIKIGDIISSPLTYVIAKESAKNLRIFASNNEEQISLTPSNSENINLKNESDSIVSKNNNGSEIFIKAKSYPLSSYTSVKWYVNERLINDENKDNILNICCGDIGEYHIYCTSEDGKIKSNTLVVPSTSKPVSSHIANYYGDVNGRSVNSYITSQSDFDAYLEYIILTKDAINDKQPNIKAEIYIDTAMQDIWKNYDESLLRGENVYAGERYWMDNDRYVNSSGSAYGTIICNMKEGSSERLYMASRSFYRLGYSGSFSCSPITNYTLNKNTNITLHVLPTDEPTRHSGQGHIQQYEENHGGFKYDEKLSNTRNFKIDEIAQTVKVSTSSQLYDAIDNGFRPICESGSMAEAIYKEARRMLKTYVTDSMTDLEKVRIINEWICYFVTYDYKATEGSEVNEQLLQTAYYLEGVFVPAYDGRRYAVCDGRSKAFQLLCAIEGINCVRVTGVCYNKDTNKMSGGHAWNKVCIQTEKNGPYNWYIVDTTWNDPTVQGTFNKYEKITNNYFLVSDYEHENGSDLKCVEDKAVKPFPPAPNSYTEY